MKFQLYSDIHLEYYKKYPKIPRFAPYLFLAGDIGKLSHETYKAFIRYCSETWYKVLVVLGNHEFYHSKKTYDKLLREYREFFEEFNNVYLLEKDACIVEDYNIIGLTYWSYISNECNNIVNCPRKILKHIEKNNEKRTVGIGLETYNNMYLESSTWLKENYDPIKKTIILTHHPLTQKNTLQRRFLCENHSQERMDVFSNNVSLEPQNTLICLSGHTHYSHDFTENNIRYISNQMGYKDELLKNYSNFNGYGLYEI
jgi:predicted phosphodiesterase